MSGQVQGVLVMPQDVAVAVADTEPELVELLLHHGVASLQPGQFSAAALTAGQKSCLIALDVCVRKPLRVNAPLPPEPLVAADFPVTVLCVHRDDGNES